MIKAVIVDDEPSAGEVLEILIKKYTSHIQICEVCTKIPQAIEAIEKHKPGIIFLDIELGSGSGFEILEHFSELKSRVVFVTAYEHYAVKAIKHNAFDYILKPILPEELKQTIDKIFEDELENNPYPNIDELLKQLTNTNNKIAINTRKGMEYFKEDDIVIIQGQGSYSKLYLTNDKESLVTKKLKDFEEKINMNIFLRVHKSYIINLKHIVGVLKEDGGYVEMNNKKKIPISNTYKVETLKRIEDLSNIV